MASSVSTSSMTNPLVATDGTLKRTVFDKIRTLFPGSSVMTSMVSPGKVDRVTGMKKVRNLIGKKAVKTAKYENVIYTPWAIEFTVSTASDGTDVVVSSGTGIRPSYLVVNTANGTLARISAVSSGTLTYKSITGQTFSASVGDKLLCLSSHYGDNSSSPAQQHRNFDTIWNTTFIARYPVGISRTAMKNPHYGTTKGYFDAVKQHTHVEALRRVAATLIWNERATTEAGTDDTSGALADTFRSTRGAWKWAQVEFDSQNSMNFTKFIEDIPAYMHESFDKNAKHIMLTSQKIYGKMVGWQNERVVVNQDKEADYFGVEASIFKTAGPKISVTVEDSFNKGSFQNKALIFDPNKMFYVYLEGCDLHPSNNIQENDRDGRIDELIGEIGIGVEDGGYGMTKILNWYAL